MFLITYGTRPEYIKVKPIIEEMRKRNINVETLFTGQHENLIKQSKPDHILKITDNGNRLNSIIISCLTQLTYDFLNKFDYVIVQGDTTSALSVGIATFHSKVQLIHLEAGLRTFDIKNPYPEESNRRMISAIADVHMCPTDDNYINLSAEGLLSKNERTYIVGNTVIDNLVKYKDSCEYGDTILITMHRRENHHNMDEWFTEINKIAINYPEYKFILPLHPNPNVQKHKHLLKDVEVIEPLGYDEFLQKLIKVKLVITDSGGIQEECSYFNKTCLVCRVVTERPEVLGTTSFLVKSPYQLHNAFSTHIHHYNTSDTEEIYGKGDSAIRIVDILEKL